MAGRHAERSKSRCNSVSPISKRKTRSSNLSSSPIFCLRNLKTEVRQAREQRGSTKVKSGNRELAASCRDQRRHGVTVEQRPLRVMSGHFAAQSSCPLWVNRGHFAGQSACPLYPHVWTAPSWQGLS